MYSPWLSPIEYAFGTLKGHLQRMSLPEKFWQFNSHQCLLAAAALTNFGISHRKRKQKDIRTAADYFEHCGYGGDDHLGINPRLILADRDEIDYHHSVDRYGLDGEFASVWA
ncbi:hypothetical protein KIPB_012114 [Kipferlia bialata]|uniref:Uncharacterized protein n=1 Tax=Kipferlia bialata TaxID=797122 RepID=A0A391NXF7_9EUKA|nr:hypothetical protein KIPB_012114 [Kipferlia bialata]|eukprot:g12114.t1